jgi:hypothetical protein
MPRLYQKSDIRRGMFLTMDAPPGVVTMTTDGGELVMKGAPRLSGPIGPDRRERQAKDDEAIEAERKAKADREWAEKVYRLYS